MAVTLKVFSLSREQAKKPPPSPRLIKAAIVFLLPFSQDKKITLNQTEPFPSKKQEQFRWDSERNTDKCSPKNFVLLQHFGWPAAKSVVITRRRRVRRQPVRSETQQRNSTRSSTPKHLGEAWPDTPDSLVKADGFLRRKRKIILECLCSFLPCSAPTGGWEEFCSAARTVFRALKGNALHHLPKHTSSCLFQFPPVEYHWLESCTLKSDPMLNKDTTS